VAIRYVLLGSADRAVSVPIVRMEAVRKGPQSTHYGNNVRMRPGAYDVVVTANGYAATFHLKLDPPMTTSNGDMKQ
jgi:hypothetical protein